MFLDSTKPGQAQKCIHFKEGSPSFRWMPSRADGFGACESCLAPKQDLLYREAAGFSPLWAWSSDDNMYETQRQFLWKQRQFL